MSNTGLHLVQRIDIDSLKWDQLIEHSPEGRIYATTGFLDCMAPGWMALIAGDYQAVMPLPVRKKFGIRYVYQPAFCQQLGVFSKSNITKQLNDQFLAAVSKHFAYAEINGHSGLHSSDFLYSIRKNYLLPLHNEFSDIEKNFSRSARRNIAKAANEGITVTDNGSPATLIALHLQRYANTLASAQDYEGIKAFFEKTAADGSGHFYYALNKNGIAIASSGYVIYKDRIVFLMNGNPQSGLNSGATHLLKASVIELMAGQNLTMDFEGSDTASFARFYEQYGAKPIDNYPFFVLNRLSLPLKWLKQRQLSKAN